MNKSIKDIREELNKASFLGLQDFVKKYESDGRQGVVSLVERAKKDYQKYREELERLEIMNKYENEAYDIYGVDAVIGGIDEVGRGPLAGPVVAACVVLPKNSDILYLNDSKKLSEKKREELDIEIRKKAVAIGIGVVSEKEIDETNILKATHKAMRMAISKINVKLDMLLVDAVNIPDIDIPQNSIIKGDAKSVSIAAASIVAKVYRDRLMVEMGEKYKGYDFEKNKGYGTAKHIEAIRKMGPCEIHRKSFIGGFVV